MAPTGSPWLFSCWRCARAAVEPCAVLLLALIALAGFARLSASAESATNAVPGTSLRTRPDRFVLFPVHRWYPTRPQSQAVTEVLTLLVFVAVPCTAALGLTALYRRKLLGNAPGWVRVALGNTLLLVFLISSSLLAAEIWYRFFVDTTDSLAFTKLSERWVTRHWRTNNAGCRDDIDYAPKLAVGKRRVTFVGDSFTAGHGIKRVENRFPNLLRRMHPDWEVHVLANIGLDTGPEIKLLNKAFFRGYELDEVVLVYCLNDVGDLLLSPGGPFEGGMPPIDEVGPWYTRGSYFVDLFYNRYKAAQYPFVRDYFAFVKDGYRGDYWEQQKQRLKEFRVLVQSHGGHLSVVTFPFLHVIGPKYDYTFVHQELDQFWTQLHVPHLDLLPVYSGFRARDLTVNAHDAHPNELADRLAADAINRTLWPAFTNHVASAGE